LKQQIDALLARARQADEADAKQPELDIPAEIARREQRLAPLPKHASDWSSASAKQTCGAGASKMTNASRRDRDGKPKGGRYKRDFGIPEDKAQENFTDPDSRIMKRAGGGFDAAYNGQLAVDEAQHITVAAELTNVASDAAELPRMIEAVQDNLGQLPAQALAEAGHRGEGVFARFAGAATELVVALGREGKQQLKFDPDKMPHIAAMAAKLQTDQGRGAYRKRKWIAEPPNGWIKRVLGFRQFSLRGLSKVQHEWKIVCAALNLRRVNMLRMA
jgi:hypothetical protein